MLSLILWLDQTQTQKGKLHKILSLKIDSTFSWQEHTNYLLKKLSRNTFLLSQLRTFANRSALKLF